MHFIIAFSLQVRAPHNVPPTLRLFSSLPPARLIPLAVTSSVIMPPKQSSFEPYAQSSSSLPLLVRMPDGERRQVDVAPNASVKDLKSSIVANLASWSSPPLSTPNAPPSPSSGSLAAWDLDFGGSVLQDSATLNDYNIPDVYGHASGLLKTITESAHTDAGKKVEALDKACAVVQGISRGEKDMERLISAVFDDDNDANDATQPSLRSLRRKGRSRIPTLNFSSLQPVAPLGMGPSPRLTAPPTPSQLIRRLSHSRPDLYDPAAAARADPASSGDLKKQSSWFSAAVALGAPDGSNGASGAGAGADGAGTAGGSAQSNPAQGASGELKRGMTWFNDVVTALGNSVSPSAKRQYGGDGDSEGDERENGNDVEGDSEDEDLRQKTEDGKEESMNAGIKLVKSDGYGQAGTARRDQKNEDDEEMKKKAEKDANMSETINAAVNAAKAAAAASATALPATSKAEPTIFGGASTRATGLTEAGDGFNVPDRNEDTASVATGSNIGEAASAGVVRAATSEATVRDDKKPTGFLADTERQVIGLEPEQIHLGDDIKIPKKRGRKRKNPHLTEEERKAQRQAQNRESAKLSRIRRKNMTAEYEKRVNTLEGENENLRDTVAALTDRLEILQNLLTISVQKRPIPQQALQQHLPGVQSTQALMPDVSSALNNQAGLNPQVGLNPQTGLNAQMSMNPTTSLAATLQQSTSRNQQRGLNPRTSVPSQARRMANLNMGYKNF